MSLPPAASINQNRGHISENGSTKFAEQLYNMLHIFKIFKDVQKLFTSHIYMDRDPVPRCRQGTNEQYRALQTEPLDRK
jgi:hypothetical protein